MTIDRVLDNEDAVAISGETTPRRKKPSIYELLAMDPEDEQRLLDEHIDKVLEEGYEILEVVDLYEYSEAKE